MSPTDCGWLVLALPAGGHVLIVALGWRRAARARCRAGSPAPPIGVVVRSPSIGMLVALERPPEEARSLVGTAFTYIDTAGFQADMAILVDPLSVLMCLVVSGVSFLIHLYSVAYMTRDQGYARFFAYLNFFVFSMLLLVLAANFVLLIVGWAFVGAASYLLISFWYRRTTATAAGIKAFVINVIGDVGLVIGAFLLFDGTGALDYAGVFAGAPEAFGAQRRPARGRLPDDPGGRVRQVRAAAAAHLAARRHGGPDAGLRADPRRHDGHRRRVPDRALPPAVRAGAHRRGRRRDHRHAPR